MGFRLNYQELHEIDITPEGTSPTWARICKGIISATPSNNENTTQDSYLCDDGYATSTVIGGQRTIAYAGHRYDGDAAQDYVATIQSDFGGIRETQHRYTNPLGDQITGPCTVTNIVPGGGDAQAKTEFSFEVHLNGKPTRTPKSAASTLTVVVAGGTATGTTSFTATPSGSNTLSYKLAAASAGTVYENSYLSGDIAYTSGDDIPAEVGQWLLMYELDENERVAAFAEQELTAGDIT